MYNDFLVSEWIIYNQPPSQRLSGSYLRVP